MPIDHDELLDVYAKGPLVLEALLRDITDDELRRAGAGEDRWSILEIVCHLRDAEHLVRERYRKMRDEDNPFMAAWHPDIVAGEGDYREQPLGDAIEGFARARAASVDILGDLDAAGWQRGGIHQENGAITIESLATHMAFHDTVHLAQISRRLLES
jgi:hypothetical protein